MESAPPPLASPADALRGRPLSIDQVIASYEELQSVNEQLQLVNDQLLRDQHASARSLAACHTHTADLHALLDATDVAALVVDRALHLRAFTPRIAPMFNLQPADAGRALADFATTLDRPHLLDELASAIASATPLTAEVDDTSGARFTLHITPRDDGALLRLVDR